MNWLETLRRRGSHVGVYYHPSTGGGGGALATIQTTSRILPQVTTVVDADERGGGLPRLSRKKADDLSSTGITGR